MDERAKMRVEKGERGSVGRGLTIMPTTLR